MNHEAVASNTRAVAATVPGRALYGRIRELIIARFDVRAAQLTALCKSAVTVVRW